ncbi:unnamed protein product, partial [Ectocarpus sp. 12 AP-2014]
MPNGGKQRERVAGTAASSASAGLSAPSAKRSIGRLVERISLKLGNNDVMATSGAAAGRDGDGGGRRRQYVRTFEEEHPCKQPLLVKSFDGDVAAGRPTDLPGEFIGDHRRSDSWKTDGAAEQGRYDAAEARGYGLYSLHAVLGQGTFGRIHLASWRHRGGGLAAAASSPASLEDRPSSRGGGGGAAGAGVGAGEIRARRTTPRARYRISRAAAAAGEGLASEALPVGFSGAAAAGAGTRRADGHRTSRSIRYLAGSGRPAGCNNNNGGSGGRSDTRHRSLFSEDGEVWTGPRGEGGGARLRLRALKSVCKRKVTEKGLVRHVETELAVLKQCSHPFIVSLSPGGQFQTSRHLHLVLNYCPGGDLFSLLARMGRLPEAQVRVCAAQLALALRHLHSKHIAYRDLKPDNVCIDARGHAVLVDFSLARTGLDAAPDGKTFTFCGSAAYAAPEIITKEGHDTRVDLWSLGCVVFEALVGEHPFRRPRGEKADHRHQTQALFDRIQRGRLEYPKSLSAPSLSLLRGLLSLNPDDRPGFSSFPPTPPAPPPPPPPTTTTRQGQQGEQHQQHPHATTALAPPTTTAPPTDSEQPVADAGKGRYSGDTHGEVAGTAPSGAGGAPPLCLKSEAGVRGGAAAAAARRPVAEQSASSARTASPGGARARGASCGERPPVLLLEHVFFKGLPGWGGPGTGGAWEDAKLEGSAVAVPALCDALDVRHFDSR